MKRYLLLLAFFAVQLARAVDVVPGEVIVKFRGDAAPQTMKMRGVNKVKALAPHFCKSLTCVSFDTLQTTTDEMVRLLRQRPDVEYAAPNVLMEVAGTPNDPYFSQQYGPQMIRMPELWDKPLITTKRPVIAIIDTGADIGHPDLVENLWTNEAELNGLTGVDDDGNGYVDDIHGWNFFKNSDDLTDTDGHGTHCAGNAAATGNNSLGICGTNPDALVMVMKVGDKSMSTSAVFLALDYAAAMGADIASMSFGTLFNDPLYEETYGAAAEKMILVAATGNDGTKIQNKPQFPAAYPFVIGVENCDKDDKLNILSNYDEDGPWRSTFSADKLYNYELRAPGTDILSTLPNDDYDTMSGTSMSCPMVAGAISRLITVKNYEKREDLVTDLMLSRGENNGCIDVMKAFETDASQRPHNVSVVSCVKSQDEIGIGGTIGLTVVVKNRGAESVNGVKAKLTVKSGDFIVVDKDEVSLGKALKSGEVATFNDALSFSVPADVDLMYKKFSLSLTLTSDNGEEDEMTFDYAVSDDLCLNGLYYEIISETQRQVCFCGVADARAELVVPAKVTLNGEEYDVVKVRYSACADNKNLERVTLPEGILAIETKAFYQCAFLKDINLPESVTTVEKNAFYGTGLTKPVHNGKLFAFMPETVTGTYTLPSGIEEIAEEAFCESQLTQVVLPSSLKKIGVSAFEGAGLKQVELPNSVQEIDKFAFAFLEDLQRFTVYSATPLEISEFAFILSTDFATLYVPRGSKSLYATAPGWCEFQNIEEFDVPTGIASVVLNPTAKTYNLHGLPVSPNTKGVTVTQGRKRLNP